MIDSFFSSWELFHNTYLAGWFIALGLSLVGVIVVAKDQIFIGAAVAQASALGLALAMWAETPLGKLHENAAVWLGSDYGLSAMAVLFSVAAAWATSAAGTRGRESHEAVTGWIYLVSASVAVLVVSHSPHGLEEVQRLLSSSIIGATGVDVWIALSLFAISAIVLLLKNRVVVLLVMDSATASALGVRAGWWAAGIAVWLGICIGLSIRVSGLLYAFGFLVLPALVAKNICREVRPMFIIAPLIALMAAVAGFVFANHWDFPPGQMSVALLAACLPLAWIGRWSMAMTRKV